MERLTKRITENQIELSAKANPTQYINSPQRVHMKHPFWNVFNRLCEYEQLEEQGLLLKLPCKVGDKVYQVLESIRVFEVTAIGVYDNRIVICTENWETGLGFSFDLKQIGKRYFLTKEEAEAKLKELENE